MRCLDDNDVVRLLEDGGPADRGELEAHLDGCDECRALVAALAAEASGAEQSADEEGDELAPGARVDHFEIIERLGRGGMGEVFLAHDAKLGRKVALKVLALELAGAPEARKRFAVEARATAKLAHPHIVAIHEIGEHQGRPYLALEHVDGQTLAERMQAARLGVAQALRIGLSIAEALAAAHAEGVVHRDLKPGNVMIAMDGRVRVLDFGLAGIAEPAGEVSSSIGGTPSHMSPEQWLGETAGAPTDVWALGVLLFESCAGRHPFALAGRSSDGRATLRRLRERVCGSDLPPRLDQLIEAPAALVAIVARCLDKVAGERPTAREVVDALSRCLRPARAAQGDDSPFRGLLPFTRRHAHSFFGRDDEVDAFLERARAHPILPVVGPSGAGKSSFVLAGVLPRLDEEARWLFVQLRPGPSPFDALDAAFAWAVPSAGSLALRLRELAEAQGASVLLFVDQLEELFTLGCPEAEQAAFLDALCTAADHPADPVRVVFTLREDFLGRVAVSASARRALAQLTVLRPLGMAALEQALSEPLEAAGYAYEDGALAGEMIGAAAGSLPLLQYAAEQLWHRRDQERRLLLRSAYEGMGGVTGALAAHADTVLLGLSSDDHALARKLLLRLVTGARTRRALARSDVADLGAAEALERVIDRLAGARLIAVTGASFELAHEALIDGWGTLRRWIDESSEELAVLGDATRAAEQWARRGHRPEDLWRGDLLHEASRAATHMGGGLSDDTRAFLAAGRALERRSRLRRSLSLALVMALLALAAGVSLWLKREADARRDDALAERREATRRRAESLREAAWAAFERGSLVQTRALVRAALEIEDDRSARLLWWRAESSPLVWQKTMSAARRAAFSPDGRLLAVARADGAVELLDVMTAEERLLRTGGKRMLSVAFSPDGAWLAGGGADEVRVWRTDADAPPALRRRDGQVLGVAFDAHSAVISLTAEGSVEKWNHRVDAREGERKVCASGAVELAAEARGERLAVGCRDGSIAVLRAAPLEEIGQLSGHSASVRDLSFAAGKIVSLAYDRTVRTWNAETLEAMATLLTQAEQNGAVALSDDGEHVVVAGAGLRALDAGDGTLEQRIEAEGSAWDLAYAPGAALLAVLGDELRLYDLRRQPSASGQSGHRAMVMGVTFSADDTVITSVGDGVLTWDVATGAVIAEQARGQGVSDVVSTANGIATPIEGTIRFWEAKGAMQRAFLGGFDGRLFSVAVSDGRTFAGAEDGTIVVWDGPAGTPRTPGPGGDARTLPRAHGATIRAIDVSRDARRIATASEDGTAKIWDAETMALLFSLDAAGGARAAGVSLGPDGRVATAGGNRVRLWNGESSALEAELVLDTRALGVRFDSTGALLAVPTAQGTVVLWEPASGQQRIVFGHRGDVNSVAFSSDGRLLASVGDDATVRVWELPQLRPRWRAPLLLVDPPALLSHLGWTSLDGSGALPEPGPWRTALEERARLASAAGALTCLITYEGTLELWRRGDQTPRRSVAGALDVRAGASACLVHMQSGAARLIGAEDDLELAAAGTRAIAWGDASSWVADDAALVRFDAAGAATRAPVRPGVSAIGVLPGRGAAVGYDDGGVQLCSGGACEGVGLEGSPAAAVTVLADGPRGTLVAGFADGTLGLWDPADGRRLHLEQVHGPIVHLEVMGARVFAASELGASIRWDLGVLALSECELLREIWAEVPFAWSDGRAQPADPPPEHRCAKGR